MIDYLLIMDPLIIDSTPKGSPILAYGSSRGLFGPMQRGPRRSIKLLALIAGSLMLILCAAFFIWTRVATIQLPENVMATIVLQPRRAAAVLLPSQIRDLATPWRIAIESRSRFPALLGVASDVDGRLHPFAVVSRTASISASGVHGKNDGLFILITDHSDLLSSTDRLTISEAFRGTWSLRASLLSFAVRSNLLQELAGQSAIARTEGEWIRGTWEGRSGVLHLPGESIEARNAFGGPFFSVLGNSDDAHKALPGLLSQGVDLRGLINPPRTIAYDPSGGGALALSWDETPTGTDARLLAYASGRTNNRTLPLPDGGQLTEFFPETSQMASPGGSTTLFLGSGLASSTFDLIRANSNCPGNTRFLLNGEAFQNTLTALNIPASWSNHLSGMRLTSSKDRIRICLE